MTQLPRLVHLVQSIPKDVPILLAPSSGRDALLAILHAKKVLDKKRIINWKSDTVYTADTVCVHTSSFLISETNSPLHESIFVFFLYCHFCSIGKMSVLRLNKVYYAGEMGKGKGTKGQWDTLKQEWCSWALVMPRQRLQKLFVGSRTVHDDRQKNSSSAAVASSSSSGKSNPVDGV